jgi:hypothetical protein
MGDGDRPAPVGDGAITLLGSSLVGFYKLPSSTVDVLPLGLAAEFVLSFSDGPSGRLVHLHLLHGVPFLVLSVGRSRLDAGPDRVVAMPCHAVCCLRPVLTVVKRCWSRLPVRSQSAGRCAEPRNDDEA